MPQPLRRLSPNETSDVTVDLYSDHMVICGARVAKSGGLAAISVGDDRQTAYALVEHGGATDEEAWAKWSPAPPPEAQELWVNLTQRMHFRLAADS